MKKYIFRFFFILIIIIMTFNCSAQNNGFMNLNEYITKNKLYDFGYGLEKSDSRLDSIVCFNDFMSHGIIFKDTDNLNFNINDSIFAIVTKLKKGYISSINILYKKKVISKLELNDSLNNFQFTFKTYRIKFENKSYSILYLTDEYSHQTFRSQFLGIIVDEKTKSILPFPRYQNTTSLLNITDLDNDKKIEIVSYNPSFSNKVEVFKLENSNWKLIEKYTCILKSTDNFVWQIDFQTGNFLKDYYQKAFR